MDTDKDIKNILEIKNLVKHFGDNEVLNGFNMRLYKGENLVIMGKSGSGKSVMIKCLMGLMQPDSGHIEIMGNDVLELEQAELDALRKKIGFLFQGSALYDSMTVKDNLEFPLRKQHISQEQKDKLVHQALESVGLLETLALMPNELSGGMKRRVALARAIILHPKIIIYDEPTTGLDPITAKEIIQLMRDIQEIYGSSALIITHDVDCSRVIADRMILLIDGINYAEGTFKELSSSEDPRIQAFFK
ncbi:ATP-binding cassette domain-containing protein [Lutimonas saemankumensis]|uniref:ABC transporter ATP-binding protein n=1 Tax=Lutimonas saemankumensis TaxID=483016 RepID=UPI001CD2EA8E|nr:ATP-binding cassette domain-containing protein [Lutimonas saemankumensis]MCA0932190.1 ATP-binding cassette domain-containing protein [Lutimonas saemankumensis]